MFFARKQKKIRRNAFLVANWIL